MIEFNAYSTIKEVRDPPNTFPAYIYHITPFSNINPFGTAATKLIGKAIACKLYYIIT
jgi:hypothetical protein